MLPLIVSVVALAETLSFLILSFDKGRRRNRSQEALDKKSTPVAISSSPCALSVTAKVALPSPSDYTGMCLTSSHSSYLLIFCDKWHENEGSAHCLVDCFLLYSCLDILSSLCRCSKGDVRTMCVKHMRFSHRGMNWKITLRVLGKPSVRISCATYSSL